MRTIATTTVLEWDAGASRSILDDLAGEDPLEIRVGDEPISVTLRTPGHDLELAAGFLLTEGVLTRPSDLERLDRPGGAADNVVRATLAPRVSFDASRLKRHFYSASSCGVCGRASIESLRARSLAAPAHTVVLQPERLCVLPHRLRERQRVFARTGGLHAAGLFDGDGALVAVREDVGRHNAVDKIVGWALLDRRLPLLGHTLLVSGRGGFEVVQKAIAAGIELVACVSAPSSLAVQLAREFGLTLVGFLRGRRFVVYSGQDRIATEDGGLAPAAIPPVVRG